MSIEIPSTETGEPIVFSETKENQEVRAKNLEAWRNNGAQYDVVYTMDVKLKSKEGTDIPLYNRYLYTTRASRTTLFIGQKDDIISNHFNSELEDYWLFYAHLNYAEMEIAIGGETPVLVNSNPSYQRLSNTDEECLYLTNQHQYKFKVSYEMYETSGAFDRFIAVRCPKMDNPAISVKVKGHYGGLHWVGLFTQTTADDTNQFIAIRTTHRLLPEYAERVKQYEGYREWYHPDAACDLVNRTITLFPKQLYATKGVGKDLYHQFVTTDPANPLGFKHFEHVRQQHARGALARAYKYVWRAEGRTMVRTHLENPVILPAPPMRGARGVDESFTVDFDYVTGMVPTMLPLNGWTMLLTAFGGIAQVATGILTVNFAGMAGGFIQLFKLLDREAMQEEVNLQGFVTTIAKAVDENRKASGKKPNTANVLVIIQSIQKNTFVVSDLGTAS